MTDSPADPSKEASDRSRCPKCGAPRHPIACPKCGLTAANMDAYRASVGSNIPEPLEAAWKAALESWDDVARHDEVIRLVTQHDAYAWAAAQYRRRPADAIRDRQLERVRKSAEASLLVGAKPKAEKASPYAKHVIVLVLLIVAAGMALMFNAMITSSEAVPPAGSGSAR